jgi:hypothetical protein
MITNGKPIAKDTNVVGHFSELAHDVVELAQLQGQLLTLDMTATWQRMKVGVLLTIVGACVLLGSVPIVLLIAAESLVEFAGWSRTAAAAVAGGGGLLAAAAILAFAWLQLQTMLESFNRSREELSRNLEWLKTSLQRQRTAAPHARPREAPLPP